MSESVFLGLDIGTSGVKAILVTPSGDVEAAATTPLTLSAPRPGWAEQDPDAWWDATTRSIREVLAGKPNASIISVGISGRMHSSVFLDRAGAVVRPALLWCDGRTTDECAEITRRAGGEETLRDWVRNPALEGFTLPKVLWLRTHEPEAYARVAAVLLAKDFIRYRLTGVLATEPSDASGTLMFDPARLRWSDEVLHATGVSARCSRMSAARRRCSGMSRPTPRVVRDWLKARLWLAVARTTRAARPAWASSRLVTRSRAGAHPAPCSHRPRSHRRSRVARSYLLPRGARHLVCHGCRPLGRRRVRVVSRSARA